MKVLFVNTFDQGGAAKACLRLYEELLLSSVDVNILLKARTKSLTNSVVCRVNKPKKLNWIQRISIKIYVILSELKVVRKREFPPSFEDKFRSWRHRDLEHYSFPYSDYDITETEAYKKADLIHFHWVADFLDWESFFKKNSKPVIWTMHDQNPFLGGEHYAERFFGIDGNGKPIKRVYSCLEINEEKRLSAIKLRCLTEVKNITIVAPSKWLLNSSLEQGLFVNFKHYLIRYSIPNEAFKYRNKSFSREVLGLSNDKKILLFISDSSATNSRKGFDYLERCINSLSVQFSNFLVCRVGNSTQGSNKNSIIHNLGRIDDERLMALAYSAADAFIIPSLEDNLPNTMLEALCCGTPVVGFPVGGISETIDNEVNGILCENISVNSLEASIKRILNDKVVFNNQKIACDSAKKYSSLNQSAEYLKLYDEILKQK